jgi:hypothetical protein
VTDAIGLRKNKKLRNSLLGLAISFRNDCTGIRKRVPRNMRALGH